MGLTEKSCVMCGVTFKQRGWKQKYCEGCSPHKNILAYQRARRQRQKEERMTRETSPQRPTVQ